MQILQRSLESMADVYRLDVCFSCMNDYLAFKDIDLCFYCLLLDMMIIRNERMHGNVAAGM